VIYVLKGMLIVFAVSLVVTTLVMAVCCLLREWQLDLRARRSARGQLLTDLPIAREYRTKDYPAWERRLGFPQARSLAARLREIGE
jgi:hypothetical protein